MNNPIIIDTFLLNTHMWLLYIEFTLFFMLRFELLASFFVTPGIHRHIPWTNYKVEQNLYYLFSVVILFIDEHTTKL